MNTEIKLIKFEEGITLESGNHLESFELIVETYGELNKSKSNGVLLCHAFSGNHHAAGKSEDGSIGGGINWLDLIKPLIQINISWFAVIILVAALVLLDQQA